MSRRGQVGDDGGRIQPPKPSSGTTVDQHDPSAQYRSDAAKPALRGQNTVGKAMPVARRQRQKALPDARRCAGIGRSARQQERAQTRSLYT